MVKLAAFPKCFAQQLTQTHEMSLFDWIEMAAGLGLEGVELHNLFFESLDEPYLSRVRADLAERGLAMPMLCYSPDFTVPEPEERQRQVRQAERMIDLVAYFGGKTCRVLSGQRRPGVERGRGVEWVVEGITALLPHAEKRGIILAMENHYKDDFWTYPEFAQQKEVFLEILDRIRSPWLGVNYDPSNAILASDDPLELLEAVKHRVVSMHASDRHLRPGHTLDELRQVENVVGYAAILEHGVIGQGMNDYDAIFATLHAAGFDGWISIEDGMKGLKEIAQSAAFLREKIAQYWVPEPV